MPDEFDQFPLVSEPAKSKDDFEQFALVSSKPKPKPVSDMAAAHKAVAVAEKKVKRLSPWDKPGFSSEGRYPDAENEVMRVGPLTHTQSARNTGTVNKGKLSSPAASLETDVAQMTGAKGVLARAAVGAMKIGGFGEQPDAMNVGMKLLPGGMAALLPKNLLAPVGLGLNAAAQSPEIMDALKKKDTGALMAAVGLAAAPVAVHGAVKGVQKRVAKSQAQGKPQAVAKAAAAPETKVAVQSGAVGTGKATTTTTTVKGQAAQAVMPKVASEVPKYPVKNGIATINKATVLPKKSKFQILNDKGEVISETDSAMLKDSAFAKGYRTRPTPKSELGDVPAATAQPNKTVQRETPPTVQVKAVVSKRVEPTTPKPVEDPVASLDWVMSAAREKQARAAAEKIQAKLDSGQKISPSDYGELPPDVGKQLAAKLKATGKAPPLQEFHAGLDPRAVIKAADNLDVPQGSFTINRKPKDAGLSETVRSPLSIVDAQGKTIQSGYYERVGGPQGKEASQLIRGTQRNMERLTNDWEHRVNGIEQRVMQGERKLFNKAGRERTASEFIDLIEKEKTDPSRVGKTPEIQKALQEHDKLTDEFRDYIITQRRDLGIETPDDWGITDKGYFRHLFLGDVAVMDGPKRIGLGKTYADAQKIAIDYLKQNPNAKIHATARDITAGDPTLRLSNRQFWKTVGNLADSAELSKSDILEDIRGVIGRKGSQQKFFGALLKREGSEGFSRAYGDVMRIHGYQVARTQELSKLNRSLTPIIENLKRENLPGLAEHMEDHLSQLWGTPSKLEKNVGAMIENIPALRNHVANPTMALRSTVQKVTRLQSFLKLDLNPKSTLVNLIQPFSTLWPYISTKDFVGTYKDFLKPSTRKMLRESGVFQGATKLEGGNVTIAPKRTLSPFSAASNVNRGIGYLFGKRQAAAAGLPEDLQHLNGLSWAEKVEFDNSQWNAPPILRTPQGRLLGQFKGYTVKALETMGNMAQKKEGEGRLGQTARLGKFGGTQLAVGGVNSLGVAAKVAGGYAIYKALEAKFREAGMDQETAKKTAEAVFYGASSLLGADLSGSVAILDPPYGRSVTDQIVNFFGGPTVGGTAPKLAEAISSYRNAKDGDTTAASKREKAIEKFLKSLTPGSKTVEGVSQYFQGKPQTAIAGKEEIPLNPSEAVLRAMGFQMVKQSKYYGEQETKQPQVKRRRKSTFGKGF